MAEMTDIRDSVRERYAAAARAAATHQEASCGCGAETAESSCCGTEVALTDESGRQVFGGALYEEADVGGATDTAVQSSLGCGVPTAVADLHRSAVPANGAGEHGGGVRGAVRTS